ncbi:uncharacterized protein SOCEGT47_065970 [Sorangium cellulosum]|uniref:Uncharacterized protein n=1 Tax=Sorangium cellulosum TaxID=56 RepID=A0A4P2Q8W8_SORCE|nr:uncharacterized protein SOCEGT47_065970 [Sorangium cellulosum]
MPLKGRPSSWKGLASSDISAGPNGSSTHGSARLKQDARRRCILEETSLDLVEQNALSHPAGTDDLDGSPATEVLRDACHQAVPAHGVARGVALSIVRVGPPRHTATRACVGSKVRTYHDRCFGSASVASSSKPKFRSTRMPELCDPPDRFTAAAGS